MTARRLKPVSHTRWEYAQRNELDYQQRKAEGVAQTKDQICRRAGRKSAEVMVLLERLGVSGHENATVLEIGSGAHGLIWKWPARRRIALDPLACFYRTAFGFLQEDGPHIIQARGEQLPLASASVDLILSENVLDHTEDPATILREVNRVLRPRGVVYCSVDIHPRVWRAASTLYNGLFDRRMVLRTRAFPAHPFHFTAPIVDTLFAEAGLIVKHRAIVEAASKRAKPGVALPKSLLGKKRQIVIVAKKPE